MPPRRHLIETVEDQLTEQIKKLDRLISETRILIGLLPPAIPICRGTVYTLPAVKDMPHVPKTYYTEKLRRLFHTTSEVIHTGEHLKSFIISRIKDKSEPNYYPETYYQISDITQDFTRDLNRTILPSLEISYKEKHTNLLTQIQFNLEEIIEKIPIRLKQRLREDDLEQESRLNEILRQVTPFYNQTMQALFLIPENMITYSVRQRIKSAGLQLFSLFLAIAKWHPPLTHTMSPFYPYQLSR